MKLIAVTKFSNSITNGDHNFFTKLKLSTYQKFNKNKKKHFQIFIINKKTNTMKKNNKIFFSHINFLLC